MGKKIGKYELGRTLGTGNFSKVKVGTDCETGQTYAIKIVDKVQLAAEHMEEQLKREIAVLKQLRHRNIVMMREVLQTPKNIYIVLELVTGGELFDRIQEQRRCDEGTARNYFQQLVMGIRYCHRHLIAHRDLKPENLLLDTAGVLKISDFGLSNLQQSNAAGQQNTMMQTVCGTPNYVAPEVLKEKGYNGFAADVWSCGVILFVMLAGYLPFDDTNINSLFNKIERGEYRMARHFSDGARDLISKLLVIDPNERITIEEIVSHPWFSTEFDRTLLQSDLVEQPTSDAVNDAIAVAVDPGSPAGRSDSSPSSPFRDASPNQPGSAPTGADGFEVLNRLMGGLFLPLSNTTNGMSFGTHRKVFTTCASAKETLQAVKKALEQMRCNPKDKEDALEIKGFTNAQRGLLTFSLAVSSSMTDSVSIVEVRRGRGDEQDFTEFVRALCPNMGSLVNSTEITL